MNITIDDLLNHVKTYNQEELEIIKLDTYQGNVSIKGRFDSLAYIESGSKKEKESSLINKLFK